LKQGRAGHCNRNYLVSTISFQLSRFNYLVSTISFQLSRFNYLVSTISFVCEKSNAIAAGMCQDCGPALGDGMGSQHKHDGYVASRPVQRSANDVILPGG
jgi:hypothetical protein